MGSNKTIELENDFAIVKIKTHGAELCSFFIKSSKKELIWNGDEKYWKRHAPVLFPTVGKLKNNVFDYEGNQFSLPQHGFARDMDFEVIHLTKESCELQITHNSETLKKYPFEFKFTTIFSLNGSDLQTLYKVENTGQKPLLFSLGAHPAFNCPFSDGENLKDYELVLGQKETSDILLLSANGLITGKRQPFLTQENTIALSEELFKNDALVFDDLKSTELSIQSKKSGKKLTISWFNFPHLGIWKPLNAPFLCIEPWQGMADNENANGNLEAKFGIVQLEKGKIFEAGYSVLA